MSKWDIKYSESEMVEIEETMEDLESLRGYISHLQNTISRLKDRIAEKESRLCEIDNIAEGRRDRAVDMKIDELKSQ
jgi:predicted  nucleic acid-binding Zn-ribbon protein